MTTVTDGSKTVGALCDRAFLQLIVAICNGSMAAYGFIPEGYGNMYTCSDR